MEAALPPIPKWIADRHIDVWAQLSAWYASTAREGGNAAAAASDEGNAVGGFEAVIARHRAAMERLCFFRERDATRRQDLWQDILLAVWKSLPSYRGEGSERAWVLKIAHNVAASHVAHAMREGRGDDFSEPRTSIGPDRRLELRELLGRVRRLDLASQQLVLLYVEGLTSPEIAEATGLTQSNVTTRLSRIRSKLSDEESVA